MAFNNWYSCAPFECAGDDESAYYIKRQPYFMLECSKIKEASFVNEISKKDIPDISAEGYLYLTKEGINIFVLDKNCTYLLGVFDSEKKRVFQDEYDSIKEKSKSLLNLHNDLTKAKAALMYQKIVEKYLSVDSDEYKKSSELVTHFEQKFADLKRQSDELEKEIETMIREYILKELRILTSENAGISIQGTLNHYLKFFINKKNYKYI
jgi:hypothetical protein